MYMFVWNWNYIYIYLEMYCVCALADCKIYSILNYLYGLKILNWAPKYIVSYYNYATTI